MTARCSITSRPLPFLILGLLLGLNACATGPAPQTGDSAEAILSIPAQQVRDALVEVLTLEGYGVEVTENDPPTVTTGFRREIDSPWDWLLRTRFGVGRTQAEARITALDELSSKLTIHVRHESRTTFWNSWTASEPPLTQGAEHYLRLVKNHLLVL